VSRTLSFFPDAEGAEAAQVNFFPSSESGRDDAQQSVNHVLDFFVRSVRASGNLIDQVGFGHL
jgi:hypothetical protein